MADNVSRDIAAFLRERVLPSDGSRHGLVIGIEEYRDARLNLRCAAADAQTIFGLMIDPDCGMFHKNNVRLLLNEQATREGIWRALSSLRRNAGENDTVWVYYAGHAAPEESSLYWVTHDADVDDLYGTGLSNDQISKVLDDIRAKRLLVLLDCCHAAATAAQKNPTRAVLTADEVFSCYKGHGRITLSSSDGKEKSVELGDVGHGAFTYFLEQGLRGEADTDGDGVVTADELWSYLRSKVADASQKAGNAQTPVLLGEMQHDFALSLNPMSIGQKKRLAELVTSLIGLGADQLTTEEAGLCLDILKRPPRTPQEEALVQELLKGLGDEPNIPLIKVLIDIAKRSTPAARPSAGYKPPAEQDTSHPTQKDDTVEDHKTPLVGRQAAESIDPIQGKSDRQKRVHAVARRSGVRLWIPVVVLFVVLGIAGGIWFGIGAYRRHQIASAAAEKEEKLRIIKEHVSALSGLADALISHGITRVDVKPLQWKDGFMSKMGRTGEQEAKIKSHVEILGALLRDWGIHTGNEASGSAGEAGILETEYSGGSIHTRLYAAQSQEVLWYDSTDRIFTPDRSRTNQIIAVAQSRHGNDAQAVTFYRRAISDGGSNSVCLNGLAWKLATSPDAGVRNGAEAIRCAEKACLLEDWKNAAAIDTLAAAHAENGEFDKAVEMQKRAMSLAESAGDKASIADYSHRLRLYEERTPFHEERKSGAQ